MNILHILNILFNFPRRLLQIYNLIISFKRIKTLIRKKEQSVIESIRDTFKGEDIRIQYIVLGYKINLYFYEHKLEIEIDELGHNDRNTDYETKREEGDKKRT